MDKKEKIIEMRKQGFSYGMIAKRLGVHRSTVSSFCARKNINQIISGKSVTCINCGEVFIQEPNKKPRKFCSDKCRVNWWNQNQDKVNKKALYELVCLECGKPFTTYGNKKQKYCSNACYIANRYGRKQVSNDQ